MILSFFGQSVQFEDDIVMVVIEKPNYETCGEDPDHAMHKLVAQETLIFHFHKSLFLGLGCA